jgi:cobalt-precorrin 5A hydrolase
VAGIGCRAGVSGAQVEAAIDAAIAELCGRGTVTAIATPAAKAKEPGIQAAAAARGVPLLAVSQQALEAADPATVTRSAHSMAAMNVHSVAEAAALAGALSLTNGLTTSEPSPAPVDRTSKPTPRLLQPRVVVGPVTCALADTTTS